MPELQDEVKSVLEALKTGVAGFNEKFVALQRQTDAIDLRVQGIGSNRSVYGDDKTDIAGEIFANPQFKAFLEAGGKGRAALSIERFIERKTLISTTVLGSATSGIVPIQRLTGIVPAAIRSFRVRELLPVIPTTLGAVDFVRVLSYQKASPAAEGLEKGEGGINLEADSERLKTLACWIPVTRQAIADLPGLVQTINVHLFAALDDEEDAQLLYGAGTGENLTGLQTQATSFDSGLLVAVDGWERHDIIGRAIQQLATLGHRPTGVVLHPADWWSLVLTKDTTGRYILGDPAQMVETRLFGLPVSVTAAQTSGTFLVGDFVSGAAIHQQLNAVIDISDSHSDFFIKNKLAIRCEERLALVTYKPAAFITGTFSTSPA